MSFLRVTRINSPTPPTEALYVNPDEVKYFSANEDNGTNLHLIHEDVPIQIKEPCEDLMMQLRAETNSVTIP